jgi:hypothetical protein
MPDADEIVVTVVHPGEGEVSIVGHPFEVGLLTAAG